MLAKSTAKAKRKVLKNNMDDSAVWLLLATILCILLSAFFSATETAYSSLNRIKLKNLATSGKKRAIRALKLSEDYDKLLTTILIGNNIVNILGASLATMFFSHIIARQDLAVTLSTIAMTVLVLIFGEISPKSLAKEVPESFAMAVSGIMYGMSVLFFPLTWLFKQWKKLLMLIFKPKRDDGLSEEELITIVDEATNTGGLDEQEGELIRSAIEFNDLIVKDIYTPRVDIFALPITATKEEFKSMFQESGFSRLPLYEEDIDAIVGVLHEKDFYKAYFDEKFDVQSYMGNVICVTMSQNISTVLKQLQKAKAHMAVVIDEYGGTAGIVTMEDIIEELVGEIWDEHDEVQEEFVMKADNDYIVMGNMSVEDLFDALDMRFNEEDFEVSTVSGWVTDLFGRVPDNGESVINGNLKFTVLETDFRRIEKLEVTVLSDEERDNAENNEEKVEESDNTDKTESTSTESKGTVN